MGTDDSSPRWRGLWWKILLGLFAVAIVFATIVVPLALKVWAAREKAGVDRRIAAIRAAGEPILPEDFVEPAVADADNLVVPIRAAIAVFVSDKDLEQRRYDLERDAELEPPLDGVQLAVLREELDANGSALATLAAADGRTLADWGGGLPQFLAADTSYNELRALANLRRDAALIATHEKRWADAIDRARGCEPLAAAMAAKRSLLGVLVSHGIRAMEARSALVFARHFDAADDAAARQRAGAWIAALLDESAIDRTVHAGLTGERASNHAFLVSCVVPSKAGPNGSPQANLASALGVPKVPTYANLGGLIWRADASVLDVYSEAIRLLDAQDVATFRARATTLRQIYSGSRSGGTNVLAGVFTPSLERAIETGFKLRNDRRLAATALAIRLYQIDHNDERPPTLDALVPHYLPAVPLDAIDGRPLRYDATRAILWSVREPGTDHGGVAATTQMTARERNAMTDDVRPLDPPAATTRPIE